MIQEKLACPQTRRLELSREYFSGACLSNRDRLWGFSMAPIATCLKGSGPVLEHYSSYASSAGDQSGGSEVTRDIAPYAGSNKIICSLARELDEVLGESLVGAYVFGSVGAGEEIAYSDLDCLLVLSKQVFLEPRTLAAVCAKVLKAQRFLTRYDPLQHHGFFTLCETDFRYYPEAYLPLATFGEAKSLVPTARQQFSITPRTDRADGVGAFDNMTAALDRKVRDLPRRINYYELKLLLSQVMLLPALYLNALGEFVSKRESFEVARCSLPPELWTPIEVASEIRRGWAFRPSVLCRILQRASGNPFLVTIFQKKVGQRPPPSLVDALFGGFLTHLPELLARMRRDVDGARIGPWV